MLSIPIPMLLKSYVSIRHKILLGMLLCSGIFVVLAALLRCIKSLGAITDVYNSNNWGIRELLIAICAVCAPGIRPLFVKAKPLSNVGSGDTGESGRSAYKATEVKIGIARTNSEGSLDNLEFLYQSQASRSPASRNLSSSRRNMSFQQRTPLSVIYSEPDSSRSSRGPSILNRASLMSTPDMHTTHILEYAEPSSEVQEPGLGAPHSARNKEIDLEGGARRSLHAQQDERYEIRQGETVHSSMQRG